MRDTSQHRYKRVMLCGIYIALWDTINKVLGFGQDEKAYMHAVIHSWQRRNSLLTDQDAFITSRPAVETECFKKVYSFVEILLEKMKSRNVRAYREIVIQTDRDT